MSFRRPRIHAAGASGLTRTEVLFLVTLSLVLATVAVGPMRMEIRIGRLARGVESARTLNTLLAQYATANNDVYPVGENTRAVGKSEGIALDLLQNEFTPNADIFAVGSTPRYSGNNSDYADLAPQNISWDFTAGANTTTGIAASAPDLLPVLYTTGETVDYTGANGHGLDLPLSGQGPFANGGVLVAYKGGNVVFLPAVGSPAKASGFISPNFKDTGTYTQIRP